MRHPGFGTIGNPPERDPVRPASDTRPSTLAPTRDPARIDPFLEELGRLWHEQPDLRFGQVIQHITRSEDWYYAEEWYWRDAIRRLLEERPKVAPESAPLEGIEQYQAEDR